MTTAAQPADHPVARSPHGPMRKRLPAPLLRALHAEWRKLSPNLSIEPSGDPAIDPEREARLAWTNSALVTRHSSVVTPPIISWNQLTQGEAKYLLKCMKEESGSNAAYRATLIARLAVELWGVGAQGSGVGDWQAVLRERLVQRFRTPNPQSLRPSEAHEMIEELLSRLARRDGVGVEDVRASFFGKKKGAGTTPAPNPPEDAPARSGRAERLIGQEPTA